MSCDLTGVYELIEAIEAIIEAADPARREALARTIDAYAEDFPDEFFWATSAQAPMLLYQMLFWSIDLACRPEAQSKPRPGRDGWWIARRKAVRRRIRSAVPTRPGSRAWGLVGRVLINRSSRGAFDVRHVPF